MPRPLLRLLCTGLLVLGLRAQPAGQPGFAPALTPGVLADLPFRQVATPDIGGPIVDLAVIEATPATFFAASATGGLWKTTNNGATFTSAFASERVHSVGAVAVFQPKPDIVWVGSGEATNHQRSSWGDGVYKSTDGGDTWEHVGLRDSRHIGRIALHPSDPDIVFVAALGQLWGPNRDRGLYKSGDGGKTWRSVLFVDNDTGVVDVAVDPADPKIMYAAAYQRRRRAWGFHGGGPGSGVYKSADGGDTWTKVTRGLPEGDVGRIGLAVSRQDPRHVYACIEQGTRYDTIGAYDAPAGGVFRSDDRGETWTLASDWNPHPMAASQIRIDPSDHRRVYMAGVLSRSEDGGKTFRPLAATSSEGADRVVWIDPRDPAHLIKGGDRGVAMSYDRGATWLPLAPLPVSQFSRISVDMKQPFWIYGGVEGRGSWAGPSRTTDATLAAGAWHQTGPGDGGANLIDPNDNRTLFTSSEYLGLTRIDLVTGERVDIAPGNPRGRTRVRRNWDTWGKSDAAAPELGNGPLPANWEAPVLLSPHDPRTVYAGTNQLWRSPDRGQTWIPLGDRTTAVDRTTLRVMTQLPSDTTLALDDGVAHYPTVTAIAESPVRRGVLWVGTDDGNLQISRDIGKTWLTIANRLPKLPKVSYVSSIAASHHAEGTAFVAFDNHRNNDFNNYLYRTTDGGATWTAIDGDLPSDRAIRVVREDPKNPQVLYLGTEFGAYVSVDQGQHWVELSANLPRVAVSDLVVHPRDNDLVMATRGRGLWILENLSALQGLTPDTLASDAHLFPVEPVDIGGHRAPGGAVLDYYLKAVPAKAALSIHDAMGRPVATLDPVLKKGVNRVTWDVRYPGLTAPAGESGDRSAATRRIGGPVVLPGVYTARLIVAGKSLDQKFEVREDPALGVSAETRRQWTDTALQLLDLGRATATVATSAQTLAARTAASADSAVAAERRELARVATELHARVVRLYSAIGGSVAFPTADQRAQIEYLSTLANVVDARLRLAQSR